MSSIAHIIRRRRNKRHRRRATRSRNRLWTGLLILLIALMLIIPLGSTLGLTLVLYTQAITYLPSPDDTYHIDPIIGATELVDRTQQTLLFSVRDPLGDERTRITLSDLPEHVIQATLWAENQPDFYERSTFNLSTTLNDLWGYMLGRPLSAQRGIIGRLVNRTLLPAVRDVDMDPDLLAVVFTAGVKQQYTPDDLLEWYLNTAYYGHDAYGIEAASQVYLGKSALDLTLDDVALLAPITHAPHLYNPFDHETAARGRQTDLLRNMRAQGAITQAVFEQAVDRFTPLNDAIVQTPYVAPEFSLYARQQAEDILDSLGYEGARMISRDGLYITTTLDTDLYEQSDCLLRAHLARLRGETGTPLTQSGDPCTALAYLSASPDVDRTTLPDTGSLMIQDVENGEILSMAGDATGIAHPPGVTLYPFVYLQSFLSGDFTPATMLLDIPQPFPGAAEGLIYTPANPDGQFRGPLNLRDAFAAMLRSPAVAVADEVRLSRVLAAAHRIGLNSLDENTFDLSLLEEGGRVSLLDMVYAYSVFASSGWMQGVDVVPIADGYRSRDPVAILKIEDATGNVLWEYDDTRRALSRTNIFGADVAYLLNDIMSDEETRRSVLDISEDDSLALDRRVAVVNGMAGNSTDSWTLGYTPQIIAGVHLTRQDNAPLSLDVQGYQGAAPLWQALMRYAGDRYALPDVTWERPENVVEYVVCDRSGMNPPPDSQCPTRTEIFLREVAPYRNDSHWQSVRVNSQTGQLATANTPANLVIDQVFFVPPDAALDWWQSNDLPLPPTEYDILSRPEVLKAVQIFLPESFAYVGDEVDIRGSIEATDFQSYQLSYGQGLNPTQWFEIGGRQTEFNPGVSMGTWDTAELDGIYTLQLAVIYPDGSRDTDFVQVTVDNIPPEISLQAGEPGQIFRYPVQTAIPVVATVNDNLALQKVEFYRNGVLIMTDDDWPWGFEFSIQRTGTEVFTATAFDQAGNTSTTEIQVEIIRDGG